jgi:UDP-N-acetylglucosamine 2-epimerase (non-hydrolysing)
VVREFKSDSRFRVYVGLSAQHRGMLDQVLKLFGLKSDIDLDLMRKSQTLFDITSRVLTKFEPALERIKPDMVLVHGDTTTTLGGSLASFYKKIPVGHVEAGLRTNDLYRPFPEEANRRLTDALTTLYFAPTAESRDNLRKENISSKRIFITGNTVIDALLSVAEKKLSVRDSKLKKILREIDRRHARVILMTAHRRENFGAPFRNAFGAVRDAARRFPDVHWIYPVHPNPNVQGPARKILGSSKNIHLMAPLDYFDLVAVMKRSALVVTDSGGLQEEAPSLGKPVLVLRDVTERPEAVDAGTVRLVGTNPKKILGEVSRLLTDKAYYQRMANAVNPYGDGGACDRIRDAVLWHFGRRAKAPAPFRPRS